MNARHPIRNVALVTLQLNAPLSLGSGKSAGAEDVLLATDANDLPVIPGSSIAGVLRAAIRACAGEGEEKELFGYVEGDQGAGSRVCVSWAHIHDAANRVREGLHSRASLLNDAILGPLLQAASAPRPHVKLSHRGAAVDEGLFNRNYIPVGHRFTFRLQLEGGAAESPRWNRLLDILSEPNFRLGGATRRGYGAVQVQALRARCFDLRLPADLADYIELGSRLDGPGARALLPQSAMPVHTNSPWRSMDLQLEAVTPWRIGRGRGALHHAEADAAPYRENIVQWSASGQATHEECVVVPGSAIRGALAHRLVFHYQRRMGHFAEDVGTTPADWDPRDEYPPLRALLGHVGDSSRERKNAGGEHDAADEADREPNGNIVDASRSRWIVEDARIPVSEIGLNNVWTQTHTSVDRFTGGVRHGFLFSEQTIFGKSIHTTIRVDADQAIDAEVKSALLEALGDLASGRLGIGAATAHGNGIFNARLDTTSPLMQWLQTGKGNSES